MDDITPPPRPSSPRIPAVEPDLLSSAIFLFSEYMTQLAAEAPPPPDDEEAPEADGLEINTREVLDHFAEELGTGVQLTLTLYLRVTALYRLLAQSPSLTRLAIDPEEPVGTLTETALVAAARLDLEVRRDGEDGAADFDPRAFRAALDIAD